MIKYQLSVEEFISGPFWNDETQDRLVLNSRTPAEPRSPTIKRKSSFFEYSDYINPQDCMDKHELDMYVPFGDAQGHSIGSTDRGSTESTSTYAFGHSIRESTHGIAERSDILPTLSATMSTARKPTKSPNRIRIVNDLELFHKGRYKTDYFPLNGGIRSPRYVTDREGNHFVSIEVISQEPGLIRIDWVTSLIADNPRYSMPYKFQTNHTSPDALDSNPIYTTVKTEACRLNKHHLVLIKSKQDELKNISSLSVFPPVQSSVETTLITPSQAVSSLGPKELIERFQLDKSQLAFTFCTLGPDGREYVPDWKTTVYSSVMTEVSVTSSTKRNIRCPNCSHCFEIGHVEAEGARHGKTSKKLKKH